MSVKLVRGQRAREPVKCQCFRIKRGLRNPTHMDDMIHRGCSNTDGWYNVRSLIRAECAHSTRSPSYVRLAIRKL